MKYKTHHQKKTKEKAFENRRLQVSCSKRKSMAFFNKNLHFIKIVPILKDNVFDSCLFDLSLKILKKLKKLQILNLNKYFFIHYKASFILKNVKKYIKNLSKKTMSMIENRVIAKILNIKFKLLSLISNPKKPLHSSNNYLHHDEYSNQTFKNQVIVNKTKFIKYKKYD